MLPAPRQIHSNKKLAFLFWMLGRDFGGGFFRFFVPPCIRAESGRCAGANGQASERQEQDINNSAMQSVLQQAQGVTLAGMRKLPEAVAELGQAVRLRPDFAQAHHNLGVALAELGNLDEAVACLRQALNLQPDYAEAYYNLGNVLVSQGKREEAVALFHHALELRPTYGELKG
jgi:Flp pilus assembly protein TadD